MRSDLLDYSLEVAWFDTHLGRMLRLLEDYLRQTGDARVLDGGEVWETYKRYSPIRQFPPPAKQPQGLSAGVVAPDDRARRPRARTSTTPASPTPY